MEEDRIKDLLKLRDSLRRQIEKTEKKLEYLRRMLETIDEVLIRVSVAPGTQVTAAGPAEREGEVRQVTAAGKILGNLSIGPDSLTFESQEGVEIPFRGSILEGWYVRKVLDPLRAEGKLGYEVEFDDAGRLVRLKVTGASGGALKDLTGKLVWAVRRVYGESGGGG